MGQKSNVNTIRKAGVQYNSNHSNYRQYLSIFLILGHLQKLFFKLDVCLLKSSIQENSNNIFLNFSIFFRTRKLIRYKKFFKQIKPKTTHHYFCFIASIIKFLKVKFNQYLINFKFCVLNNLLIKKNKVSKALLVGFYELFKRYSKLLFPRRINFFLDFIKISVLLFCDSVRSSFFLRLLSEIFTILQKKRHSLFLQFINFFFCSLISYNLKPFHSFLKFKTFNKIDGVKFIASGKLKGKSRSSSTNFSLGNIPVQSLALNIEYSKIHVFNLYGVFGFKLWLNRKILK